MTRIVVWLMVLWFCVESARAQAPESDGSGAAEPALTPPVLRAGGDVLPTWQGAPTLLVWLIDVDIDGTVKSAKLVEPSGAPDSEHALLQAHAERYLYGLRFEPARRNGVAVRARARFQHLLASSAVRSPPAAALRVEASVAASATPVYGAAAAVDAPLQATSSLNLSGKSLRRRTYFNAGDLLNGAPGFYVVQHGGGGHAEQYFLRGFDADHGTDVGFYVDDVPVNAPTHGHGQGYSDLNFIIPEMVETLEVRKGPYEAEYGDFSTAGTVNYRLKSTLDKSFVTAQGGMFGIARGVAAAKLSSGKSSPIFAGEVYRSNGPYKLQEDFHRVSLMSRGSERVLDGTLTWTLQSYLSSWRASGQIPARAVSEGLISRFGNMDPNQGGSTQRHSLALDYKRRVGDGVDFHVNTFVVRNRLNLYSDFTLFSDDLVNGDQIQQVDDRVYAGSRASWTVERAWREVRVSTRFGLQTRYDFAKPAVSRAPGRVVTTPLAASTVDLTTSGLFAEFDARWSHWLRLVGAVRYDASLAQVKDRLGDPDANQRSGERFAAIASPKLTLIFHANSLLDVYANFGSGFHSNDARGTVLPRADRVNPFARALSYEVGAKVGDGTRFQLSWAGYILNLASEIVYVGDDGSTEARGKTQRIGSELTGSLALLSWLKLDGTVSYGHAAYVDNAGNGNAVALAPRWLLQSGLEAEHRSGLSGRLTFMYVGNRPATPDGFLTAQGFPRLDATVEYKRDWYGLQLALQNITNTAYRQAQFATVTRLRGETSCPSGTRASSAADGSFVGCEDISFTPGLPLTVMGSGTLYF